MGSPPTPARENQVLSRLIELHVDVLFGGIGEYPDLSRRAGHVQRQAKALRTRSSHSGDAVHRPCGAVRPTDEQGHPVLLQTDWSGQPTWHSQIVVINSDGSDLRQINVGLGRL